MIKKLLSPYKVIKDNISEFIIWFLFTIIMGQAGIIAKVLIRKYSNETPIFQSIYSDSISGNFYTFAIALVAAVLGPLFINLINSEKLKFKSIKVLTIIAAIFFLFITGIIYASVQSKNLNQTGIVDLSIDWTQLLLYIFAIAFASYGYSILRLELSKQNFNDVDDPLFNEEDDINVKEVFDLTEDLVTDKNGVEL